MPYLYFLSLGNFLKSILLLEELKRKVKPTWTPVFQHLAEHVDTPQLASSFEATINKFDKNFSAHLLDLLARLSMYSTSDCEHGMASVISRWVWAALLSWALSLPPRDFEAQVPLLASCCLLSPSPARVTTDNVRPVLLRPEGVCPWPPYAAAGPPSLPEVTTCICSLVCVPRPAMLPPSVRVHGARSASLSVVLLQPGPKEDPLQPLPSLSNSVTPSQMSSEMGAVGA